MTSSLCLGVFVVFLSERLTTDYPGFTDIFLLPFPSVPSVESVVELHRWLIVPYHSISRIFLRGLGLLALAVAGLVLPLSTAAADAGRLTAIDLRCDAAVDPLGVDSTPPRLSWRLQGEGRGLRQTAWHVLVASSRAALDANRGDVWDSGRVQSDDQACVVAARRPLERSDAVDADFGEIGHRMHALAVEMDVQQPAVAMHFLGHRPNDRLVPPPPHLRTDQRIAAPRAAEGNTRASTPVRRGPE